MRKTKTAWMECGRRRLQLFQRSWEAESCQFLTHMLWKGSVLALRFKYVSFQPSGSLVFSICRQDWSFVVTRPLARLLVYVLAQSVASYWTYWLCSPFLESWPCIWFFSQRLQFHWLALVMTTPSWTKSFSTSAFSVWASLLSLWERESRN